MFSDNQKIGIALSAFGCFFLLLGVLLFFDRALLALGNLFFLAGVTLIVGLQKTFSFFFQTRKLRGSVTFFGGILLLLSGWTFVGFVVEGFGFINLFGDFFPVVLNFLRQVPVVGTVLSLPVIRDIVNRIVHGGRLPV
jgi:hypothetical protein